MFDDHNEMYAINISLFQHHKSLCFVSLTMILMSSIQFRFAKELSGQEPSRVG